MRISGRGPAAILLAVLLMMMAQAQRPAAAQQPQAPKTSGPTKLPEIVVPAPAKKKAPVAKAKPAPLPVAPDEGPTAAPAQAATVRMAPAGGSELPLDKVPAGITLVTGAQIDRAATPALTDVINTYVPGAT